MPGLIYKYVVGPPDPAGRSLIVLPYGSRFLSVGQQKGQLVVWVERGCIGKAFRSRTLYLCRTGDPRPFDPLEYRFLGTVQVPAADVEIVWHVWCDEPETGGD